MITWLISTKTFMVLRAIVMGGDFLAIFALVRKKKTIRPYPKETYPDSYQFSDAPLFYIIASISVIFF